MEKHNDVIVVIVMFVLFSIVCWVQQKYDLGWRNNLRDVSSQAVRR